MARLVRRVAQRFNYWSRLGLYFHIYKALSWDSGILAGAAKV
jgi:hypothetical protein